jgi:hypothetical protein
VSQHTLHLQVNGKSVVADVPAGRLLADFLRDDLHLTGTNLPCCLLQAQKRGRKIGCDNLGLGRLLRGLLALDHAIGLQAQRCASQSCGRRGDGTEQRH